MTVITGLRIYKRCSKPATETIYDEVGPGLIMGSNDNH